LDELFLCFDEVLDNLVLKSALYSYLCIHKSTHMGNQLASKLTFEFAWWLVTAIICYIFYYTNSNVFEPYPFLMVNMIFIVTFITVTRYVFLLRHTPLANSRNLMIVLIFVSVPLFLYILNEYRAFKMFWDDGKLLPFLVSEDFSVRMKAAMFFRKQMMFFSIGSMIAIFIFPFTLLKAVWRKHNKGYV